MVVAGLAGSLFGVGGLVMGGCGVWLLGIGWGLAGLGAAGLACVRCGASDWADVSASVAAAIADLGGAEVGVDAGADGAGSSLDARCELVGFAAGSHLYAKSWLGRAFCAAYAARAGFGWRKSFEVNGNE